MAFNDCVEFGYTNLTIDEVTEICEFIADGTYSKADPVARIIVNQIDQALGPPGQGLNISEPRNEDQAG